MALTLALAAAGLLGWLRHVEDEQDRLAMQHFNQVAKAVSLGLPPTDSDGAPITFPTTPLGRMLAGTIELLEKQPARSTRIVDAFYDERTAWSAAAEGRDPAWLAARREGSVRLTRELAAFDEAIAVENDLLDRLGPRNQNTEDFARRVRAGLAGEAAGRDLELRVGLRRLAALWNRQLEALAVGPAPAALDEERARLTEDLAVAVRLIDAR